MVITTQAGKRPCLMVLIILGLFAPFVKGQHAGSLQGRVIDPQGHVAVGAVVRLYDRNNRSTAATRSQPDGTYRFENVAEGEYLLEAEAADAALTASRTLHWEGREQAVDIRLEITGVQTQVLVTASSTPLSLDEVAKAADVVGGDEISRRAEFSVSEAIRHTPGVRVTQLRGPGGLATVHMRGLRSYDTAVLIDGLRFRDAAGTQGDAGALLPDLHVVDTDRVEMLRGSGSSLYGSHAMGGVLNIVSAQGGRETHGEILAEGGGLGLVRGLARIGGGLAGQRFVYSGGISHLNVAEGVDTFDPYRNSSGQGFAKYHFTPLISLSGRIWASDAFSALNESPTFDEAVVVNHPENGPVRAIPLPPDQLRRFARNEPFEAGNATFVPAFDDPDNHRASSFLAGAVMFTHQLSPGGSYRLSYHGVETNRSFRDGPAGRSAFDPAFSSDGRFDGRTDTLQARTDHRLGLHHLVTAGYEYEREEYFNFNTDENPEPALRPNSAVEIEQSSQSVFAQDQIRVADGRLQVALSGRMQRFHLEEPFFSGDTNPYRGVGFESPKTAYTADGALAYFFRSTGTKLRAHGGNAYRAPSSFERLGGSFFFGAFSFWGDPVLHPERSVAFDAGIDQWLAEARIQLSGTFFYTALQEVIVFDFGVIDPATDPWGRSGGYRNTGGGLARGAEFSVRAAPTSSMNLLASYTYTNSDSRTPTIPGEGFFKVLGVSDHLFTATVLQRIGRRFDVAFDLFAASDNSHLFFGSPRRLVLDGPVKADLVGSYTWPLGESKALQLYGKIENVFDHRYYETGFEAPGAWGLGGLKFRF